MSQRRGPQNRLIYRGRTLCEAVVQESKYRLDRSWAIKTAAKGAALARISSYFRGKGSRR